MGLIDGKLIDYNGKRLPEELDTLNEQLADIATVPKDATAQLLQVFFNDLPDGSYIKFPRVTYILDNVIKIDGKKNLKIDANDATFTINKHGFGIFELSNCQNIEFVGGELLGAGNFPDNYFDGATLHNEKHDYTSYWGFHRNDSLTSTPIHNGGHLGNVGIGLLIHNGCKHVKVRKVTAKYFNYVGIAIGFLGDGNNASTPVTYSENISIKDCVTEGNFGAGIHVMACDGFEISNNRTLNNGHPDATANDSTIDPGYGLTCRGAYYHAKNGVIAENYSKGNKRKGLDSHACENVDFINNKVFDALVGGIIVVTQGSYVTKNYRIEGNWIENCGNSQTTEGNRAIQAAGDTIGRVINNMIINCANALSTDRHGIDAPTGTKIIEGNTLIDSGAKSGMYLYTRKPFIKNNKFFDTKNTIGTCIWIATGTNRVVYMEVEGNHIETVGTALRFENVDSGKFDGNKVIAVTAMTTSGTNVINVGSKNRGIDWTTVSNIGGMIFEPETHVISVTITSGVITYSHKSGNIVSSIVDLDKGMKINLNKNSKYSSVDVTYRGSSDRNAFPNIYLRSYGSNYIDIGLGNTLTSAGIPASTITALSIDLTIRAI